MVAVYVVCSILAVIAVVVGLLLSRSGSSSGLSNLAGQDLEIFKKTKDKGIIKFLQILLFFIAIALIIVTIVVHYTVKN